MKRDKALRNIELVDKNYALENNLAETTKILAALMEQN